ncbi:MAG: AAA family ATPase, partial [Planctomycetota bacterium]
MSLFARQEAENLAAAQPLAVRMRPRTLDEFVGQSHFLGPGKLLRRMLQADRLQSVIFYGPPGTGKTSLAELIAQYTQSRFRRLNAAACGVAELRQELNAARDRLATAGERTVLFIDELHRFNKTQQDVLLPEVESGIVRLIGATTANPFFSLVSPLVSRSHIFHFQPLSHEEILTLLRRALTDPQRGLGGLRVDISDEALDFLAHVADGDARRALNALEIAVLSQLDAERTTAEDRIVVDLAVAEECIQQKALAYDADTHYDVASAFIKSIRGSDPDAAIYWLA